MCVRMCMSHSCHDSLTHSRTHVRSPQVPMCCACSDVRPVLEGDTYPCYEDGVGWRNTDARDSGYCPVCNPKNYEAWERRIRLERERKRVIKEEQALREKQILLVQENDRVRAAALAKVDSTTHTVR
jgi:hypothetical protein